MKIGQYWRWKLRTGPETRLFLWNRIFMHANGSPRQRLPGLSMSCLLLRIRRYGDLPKMSTGTLCRTSIRMDLSFQELATDCGAKHAQLIRTRPVLEWMEIETLIMLGAVSFSLVFKFFFNPIKFLENSGASTRPCDETYKGPSVFSEIETQVLRNYFERVADNCGIYLSVHSYGQWLLYPYGHMNVRPQNSEELNYVGESFAQALAQRYGTKYIYGTTYECLCKFILTFC